MTLLKRAFYIYPEDNENIGDLYTSIREGLHLETQGLLQTVAGEAPELNGWPNVNWAAAGRNVSGSEWTSKTTPSMHLLQLTLHLPGRKTAVPCKIDVTIGKTKDESIVVTEKQTPQPFSGRVDYRDRPHLTTFEQYQCKDEDGYRTDGIYYVAHGRVPAFVEFLRAESRRLPVVLFSPGAETTFDRYEKHVWIKALGGLAHLIRLADQQAVHQFSALVPSHTCYNGAVRLYWPNYDPEVEARQYPFWTVNNQKTLLDELLAELGPNSLLIFDRIDALEQLRRQRRKQYRESETFYRKGLEAIVQKNQAQREAAEWADLVEAADQELKIKEEQLAALEIELAQLRDDNRRLRWQLNMAWQRTGTEIEEEAAQPQLYLSERARDVYEALDGSDRAHWEKQILFKLRNSQQRDGQSEPVRGDESQKCFVFPRGQGGDGRRVMYYCDEDDVYVCELLKHDRRYDQLRTEGVNPTNYGDFRLWQMGKYVREESLSYKTDADHAKPDIFEPL